MLLEGEALEQKTNEYLENMRNARRDERFKGSSDISGGVDQSGTKSGHGNGAGAQPDARNPTGLRGSDTDDANGPRSTKKPSSRFGSFARRLGYGDPRSSEGNDPVTIPFGLEPIDKIALPNDFKLPDAKESKPTFPVKNKPLTQAEAIKLRDTLPNCIIDYGTYVDRFIHYRSKVENAGDIWGDFSLEEAGTLANILIRRGQSSGYAAELVRTISNSEEYIAAGVMMIPRVIKTVEELRQAPRQRKIK